MFFFISAVALSVGLITFLPSFNLSLFGDDWLTLHRYATTLGPDSTSNWNHLSYFLTPYGPQDISMGLLQKIFDFNPLYYFSVSFFLRSLATLSLIPITFYLTRSKLATFFAMLFFVVTTTGLETTNWVFNMPTYLSISLFNIFLFFFIKSRDKDNFKMLLISGVLFYVTYITQPIRMTGLVPFVLSIELFSLFLERNRRSLKKSAIRIGVIAIAFTLVVFAGNSLGSTSGDWTSRLVQGAERFSSNLKKGNSAVIFYPIITYGSTFIPDIATPYVSVQRRMQLLKDILIPTFTVYGASMVLLYFSIKRIKPKHFVSAIFAGGVWSLIVSIIWYSNRATISSVHTLLLTFGGYFIIVAAGLLIIHFKNKRISLAIFASVAWSLLAFILPWFWSSHMVMNTTHRYLTTSSVGATLLLATIISLGKNTKYKILIFLFVLPLAMIQAKTTRNRLDYYVSRHGVRLDRKIWEKVPYIPEFGQDFEPLIFYFEGDKENSGILFDTLIFGFSARLKFIQNVRSYRNARVFSDYGNLISAVTDGQSLKKHGLEQKPVDIDRIYAFQLIGKDNLINNTESVRNDLRKYKK